MISNDELSVAFRSYLATARVPTLSDHAKGYARHAAMKAIRTAAARGEEPNISHHPLFLQWSQTTDGADRIEAFLCAILQDSRAADPDGF